MPLALPISNFVTVTVALPGVGLRPYAVNNLLIVTSETPVDPLAAGYGQYRDSASVKLDWGSDSEVYDQAIAIFSQAPNILSGNGVLTVVQRVEESGEPPESFGGCMARVTEVLGLFYGGAVVCGYTPDDDELIDAVAYGQANNKLVGVARNDSSALTPSTGIFATITEAANTAGRGWYYTLGAVESRVSLAAYMSRLMSVDYTGSNTTLNMQAKTLVGVSPDTGITQTILGQLADLGADCYANFGGGGQELGKVYASLANQPSDLVQNTNWLSNALQVAVANVLFTTSTKIPQTEPGMQILEGAIQDVLETGVRNGFIAPGAWNGPDRFGDPVTFLRNIAETGYYIYHTPIALQSQADRAARRAPLFQVAVKTAGAVDTCSVLTLIEP